jgi:hypothetical protein
MALQPKVLFAIPCDDIRQEANGKFILIGVYSEAFVPERLPTPVRLVLALFMDIEEAGLHEIELELRHQSASPPAVALKMQFEAAAPVKQAMIPIPPASLLIGQPGDLTVHYGPDKIEIMRLAITPPNSIAA